MDAYVYAASRRICMQVAVGVSAWTLRVTCNKCLERTRKRLNDLEERAQIEQQTLQLFA